MKFLKKFVLLCVVALGLAACGGGGGGGSTTTNPPAFGAPSGLVASSETGAVKVDLSWSAVTGAQYYNIYRSTSASVTVASANKIDTVVTNPTTTSPYIDSKALAGGTTYYYVVTAVQSGTGTESAASAVQSASTIAVPATPTAVAVTPGNATLTVNWTASAGNTTPDGYKVYWATSPTVTTTNTVNVKTVSGTTASLTATDGIANGSKYYVIITAYKGTKESVATAAVYGIPLAANAAPTNPSDVVANTMDFGPDPNNPANEVYEIYLTWKESDTVDSYNIYYSYDSGVTANGSPSVTATATATPHTSFNVTNMTGNVYVLVTAVKNNVESAPCALVTALPMTFDGLIASGKTANYVNATDNDNLTLSFTSGTAVTITGSAGGTPVNDTSATWSVTGQYLTVTGSDITIVYTYAMQQISAGPPVTLFCTLAYNHNNTQRSSGAYGTMTIQ